MLGIRAEKQKSALPANVFPISLRKKDSDELMREEIVASSLGAAQAAKDSKEYSAALSYLNKCICQLGALESIQAHRGYSGSAERTGYLLEKCLTEEQLLKIKFGEEKEAQLRKEQSAEEDAWPLRFQKCEPGEPARIFQMNFDMPVPLLAARQEVLHYTFAVKEELEAGRLENASNLTYELLHALGRLIDMEKGAGNLFAAKFTEWRQDAWVQKQIEVDTQLACRAGRNE